MWRFYIRYNNWRRFEGHNINTKESDLLTYRCRVLDDSVKSLAIAKALLLCNKKYDNLH